MSSRSRGHARTAPDAADPRLRGRTLAVPFEDVWRAATALAGGGLRGWSIAGQDDETGVIDAHAGALVGEGHRVTVSVGLDENAQTRIDAAADALAPATDFGRAARCLNRFFSALDRALAARPERGVSRR